MKNSTECSVCGRRISAVRNWARWQSGQTQEWRVVRHRATEERQSDGKRGQREVICPGSGILVYDADVTDHRKVSA